jgi:2-dehydro-3-deoxy-L-rhamnonate dehydrogenase (NAD+)
MANLVKTALVTGASSGIGAEFSRRLDQMGYQLTLLGRSKERLETVGKLLSQTPSYLIADLSERAGRESAAAAIRARPDGFDLVVPNAGVAHPAPLAVSDAARQEETIAVNLLGNMQIIQAALPAMLRARKGDIIAVVSMGGIIALENYTAYSASKFGMRGFLWSLSGELKGTGVNVSGMYCSAVDTPMLHDEARNPYGSPLNFMGKVSTPQEVVTRALKALEKPQLEIYLPYGDSWTARMLGFFPGLLKKVQPMFISSGEKGRKKYLEKLRALETTPS